MRTYADVLARVSDQPTITRGPKKGAHKLWRVVSSREYAYIRGDRIEFYLDDMKMATATPSAITLSIDFKYVSRTVAQSYMWSMFRINVYATTVHSLRQLCVMPNPTQTRLRIHKTYRYYEGITFSWDGACLSRLPFFGARKPKQSAKRIREAAEAFTPVYLMSYQKPDPTVAGGSGSWWEKSRIIELNPFYALVDTDLWPQAIDGLNHTWMAYNNEPIKLIHALVWRAGKFKEQYITQTYEVLR